MKNSFCEYHPLNIIRKLFFKNFLYLFRVWLGNRYSNKNANNLGDIGVVNLISKPISNRSSQQEIPGFGIECVDYS